LMVTIGRKVNGYYRYKVALTSSRKLLVYVFVKLQPGKIERK